MTYSHSHALMRFRITGILAVLFASIGCSGESPTSLCTGALEVSVGNGVHPSLSWAPACAARTLSVVPVESSGTPLPTWSVSSSEGISPPVQIGSSPSGTLVHGAGATLTVGQVYRAFVSSGGRFAESTGEGSLTFTAQP